LRTVSFTYWPLNPSRTSPPPQYPSGPGTGLDVLGRIKFFCHLQGIELGFLGVSGGGVVTYGRWVSKERLVL